MKLKTWLYMSAIILLICVIALAGMHWKGEPSLHDMVTLMILMVLCIVGYIIAKVGVKLEVK